MARRKLKPKTDEPIERTRRGKYGRDISGRADSKILTREGQREIHQRYSSEIFDDVKDSHADDFGRDIKIQALAALGVQLDYLNEMGPDASAEEQRALNGVVSKIRQLCDDLELGKKKAEEIGRL